MSITRAAMKWGEKDFHAGWPEEQNPYHQAEYRKAWLRGYKRAKGREWLRTQRNPDNHLGGVAA